MTFKRGVAIKKERNDQIILLYEKGNFEIDELAEMYDLPIDAVKRILEYGVNSHRFQFRQFPKRFKIKWQGGDGRVYYKTLCGRY